MIHHALRIFAPRLVVAVGQVVTAWGLFENSFVGWLEVILHHADAGKLYSKIPPGFDQKVDAFRKATAIAFADCPELVARYGALLDTAKRLSGDRNILCHGMWLSHPDGKVTVSLAHGRAAQVFFYEVTEHSVSSLGEEIAALFQTFSFINLSMSPVTGFEMPELSSLEVSALQSFHSGHVANHPRKIQLQRPRHLAFRG